MDFVLYSSQSARDLVLTEAHDVGQFRMREVFVEAVDVPRTPLGVVDTIKVRVIEISGDALVVTSAVEDAVSRND